MSISFWENEGKSTLRKSIVYGLTGRCYNINTGTEEKQPGNRLLFSLFPRKLRSYETKTPRKDRTAAEMKMAPERPAAGGESCVAGFFFIKHV